VEIKLDPIQNLLNILSDKRRLSIISVLQKGPLTAGEIEQAINATQPTTSFHLKKLVEANILTVRQDGIRKIYQVRDPQLFDLLHSINSYLSSTDVWSGGKKQQDTKIVVMGLDGSGKTALILSLKGEKNLLSYFSIQPTSGLKTIRDIRATFWELGGQIVYRQEYLSNPRRYLDETEKLIFVIDVQAIERYSEALQYLSQVLSPLTTERLLSNIIVFLHKFDPVLEHPEEFTDAKISERLISKIVAMVPPSINCQIYKSSIFTVFQKTLIMQVGLFP
jgi:ArsR family transcriptional regulator